jgi:FkbM family methyltransferase
MIDRARRILRRGAGGPARSFRGQEKLRRTRSGHSILEYPSHSLIGETLRKGHGWDTVLVPILKRLVRDEAPLIVEVGTNFGASLAQMELAKPNARFVCFEPSSHFRWFLERNVARNGWNRVTIEPFLVTSAPGESELFRNGSTASSVAREYDGHLFVAAERVQATTLDAYFENWGPVTFVKIDTDGSEHQVLLGGRRLLERDRPLLFVELQPSLLERAGSDEHQLLNYLSELGYRDYLVFSNYGEALEAARTSARVLELARTELYLDLLCVHSSQREEISSLDSLCAAIGASCSIRTI